MRHFLSNPHLFGEMLWFEEVLFHETFHHILYSYFHHIHYNISLICQPSSCYTCLEFSIAVASLSPSLGMKTAIGLVQLYSNTQKTTFPGASVIKCELNIRTFPSHTGKLLCSRYLMFRNSHQLCIHFKFSLDHYNFQYFFMDRRLCYH